MTWEYYQINILHEQCLFLILFTGVDALKNYLKYCCDPVSLFSALLETNVQKAAIVFIYNSVILTPLTPVIRFPDINHPNQLGRISNKVGPETTDSSFKSYLEQIGLSFTNQGF